MTEREFAIAAQREVTRLERLKPAPKIRAGTRAIALPRREVLELLGRLA